MKGSITHINHLFKAWRIPLFFVLLSLMLSVVFPGSVHAQVINNEGAVVNVTPNTVVESGELENTSNTINNDGTFNLISHFSNQGTTQGNGAYNLGGNWTNTGSFNAGIGSVQFRGNNLQDILSGGDTFYNLIINNSGVAPVNRIILNDNVTITNTLNMNLGIVQTGPVNIFYLNNPASASLIHNTPSGSRVIGKFERDLNSADKYLFPVGSVANYNPLNIDPVNVPSAGSLLSEFISEDPTNVGLPIIDDSVEIYSVIKDGYWSLTSKNGFSSDLFDMDMDGAGFSDTIPVQDITRIIKRPAGSDWAIDGVHVNAIGTVGQRVGLTGNIATGSGNHFAFGSPRPRIITQPFDTTVCDGTEARFSVEAQGIRPLRYQWYEFGATGWQPISDGGIYSGATTPELVISSADLSMDGFRYRVRISHRHGHVKWSRTVILNVDPIPYAIATPKRDTLCNVGTTNIQITSDVPGSTFTMVVDYSGVIQGSSDVLVGGDEIIQTLTNPTDVFDSVVYIITPTGPGLANCVGYADTAIVYVNPTPRLEITVVEDTLCDEGTSLITVTSPTILAGGVVLYDYTIENTSGLPSVIDGYTTDFNRNLGSFTQTLDNHTDTWQWVQYRIHPHTFGTTNGSNCDYGAVRDSVFTIYVNPTPRVIVVVDNDTLCDETTSTITVTSPTVLTDGEVLFDLTVENVSSGNISGQVDILTQSLGSVTQTLDNLGIIVETVEYRIHPYTIGSTAGTNCDYGSVRDSVFDILVNPTPRISAIKTPADTLYCYDTEVFFDLSNIVSTTGTILYDLDVSGDEADFIGESSDAFGVAPLPGIDFSDALTHTSSLIRQLTYTFTPYIDDAFGTTECYNGVDTAIIVRMVPELIADTMPNRYIGGNNIRCNGLEDGLIYLDAIGGDYRADYTFIWEDSLHSEIQNNTYASDSIKNLPAGWYYYSIEDRIGCFLTDSILLTEPDTLFGVETIVLPLCANQASGDITMDIYGGIEGYEYLWIERRTLFEYYTRDLIDVRSGGFDFFVTDTNGCVFSDFYTIDAQKELDFEIASIYEPRDSRWNLKCKGDSNSYVSVRTIDGTAEHPVEYWWYDSPTSLVPLNAVSDSLLSNLSAGTYYAEAIDDNGCIDPDGRLAIEINEPDSITFSKINLPYAGGWDISCYGLSDGLIDLEYLGGSTDTLKNTFVWTGPGIDSPGDSIQADLVAGDYTVHVTDYLGCTADTSLSLLQPPQINYWLDTSEYVGDWNISCFGLRNGWITFDSIQGGGKIDEAGIYTYNWTALTPPEGYSIPDPASQNQSNLPAGQYQLEVRDQIDCPRDTIITLLEPDVLESANFVDTIGIGNPKNDWEISCYGLNDGLISIDPAGGQRSYVFDWTGADVVDGDTLQQDLYAGTYEVLITDANGCDTSYSFTLESPDTIMMNSTPGFIECFGETDTIFVSPSGGHIEESGVYTYLWDFENRTSQDLEGVVAGTYYVTITDDNNCFIYDSSTLEQSPEIIPVIDITSDYGGREISCYGFADAIVEVFVEGGNPGYEYAWSNGESGLPYIENLDAGTYSVIITDQYDCSVSADTTVVDPPQLEIVVSYSDPLCHGAPTGEINLFPNGGTPYPIPPQYTFVWTNPAYSGNHISELPEGEYTVSILDQNECRIDTTISLIYPDSLELEYDTTSAECIDEANGAITITYTGGGTAPYLTSVGEYFDTHFPNLLPGDYVVVLTDANGCILEDTATIDPTRQSCLTIPNAFTPNGDGFNDTWILDEDEDGTTDMIYYPDAELRIYNRWGELIYFTNNVAGEPWDGTYKGRDMPIDSYHYILDLNNGDPPVKGNVTIIR